jgi:uncharacterized protein (DUF302 family)
MASDELRKVLQKSHDEVLRAVPEALKTEGFGVLTEIDVQETLKKKLGAEFRRYRILGACNPPLAKQALEHDLEIGRFLPCNVVVYEDDEKRTVVSAVDPRETVAAHGNAAMRELADTVRQKLARALTHLVQMESMR